MTTANETAKMLEELKNEIEEEKQIISSLPFWGYIGADDQVRAKHVKLLAENGVKRVAHLDGLEMGFLRFDDAPRGTT